MQRLQLLSSQQEVLRRRIALQVPSPTPLTVSSPEYCSLSSSPTDLSTSSHASTRPIPTVPGAAHASTIPNDPSPSASDQQKLREINEQIKATLTELLNTDSVRADERSRMWIQARLMDVEKQIRKQRRRHSSGDREFAESIAEHMTPSFTARARRASSFVPVV